MQYKILILKIQSIRKLFYTIKSFCTKSCTFAFDLSMLMKPFLSFCVVLILFQSLILGSLVKLELPENISSSLQETMVHKQEILDLFLLPDNSTVQLNLLSKNDWVPIYFNNKYSSKNVSSFTNIEKIFSYPDERLNYTTISVFILNGTLRI